MNGGGAASAQPEWPGEPPDPLAAACPPDARAASTLIRFSGLAAVTAIAMGVVVLLGWLLDLPTLKSVLPGQVAMKVNTALAFILSGASLLLLPHGSGAPRHGLLGGACAAGVALLGLATLCQYAFGWNLGIDQALLAEPVGAAYTSHPGRMSPLTATAFLLLGAALLLSEAEAPRAWRPAQAMASTAVLIAFVPALGYAYGVMELTGLPSLTSMALHTSLQLLVLSLGVLAARPLRGPVALLASAGPGGQMARRLLPAIMLLPAVIGAARLAGERAGFYQTDTGVALFVVAVTVGLAGIVWRYAGSLNRVAEERARGEAAQRLIRWRAEREVQDLNASLEHRVAERTRMLEAAYQAMEAFSYSVAHDLRAPLRAVDGFARFLDLEHGRQLEGDGKRLLGRIREAAQKMGHLIDDLLKMSHVSHGEMHLEQVDLGDLARGVAKGLRATDPARHMTFAIATRAPASCDPSLLAVVLENLLGNAWKFTRSLPEGRIEFGVGARDGESHFFVRDNGAGFDMAYAGKLFTPFERLHPTADYPGSGIGLATVARIIERHGGRVWAEGALDEGAAFYFTLPAAPHAGVAGESEGSGRQP